MIPERSAKARTLDGNWHLKTQEDGKAEIVDIPSSSPLRGSARQAMAGQAFWLATALPGKDASKDRTLVHFEAVDHEATVLVNGVEIGKHVGGFTPFSFDITDALKDSDNELVVKVNDATEGYQIRGKQALKPRGITYPAVSGIWQSVWLEQVPERSIEDLDYACNIRDGSLQVTTKFRGAPIAGESMRITVSLDGQEITSAKGGEKVDLTVAGPKLWSPDTPHLYDVKAELLDAKGGVVDSVKSYTAFREVGKVLDERGRWRITLNGKEIFLLGVLDQGWWPGTLMTAPSEKAMVADLEFVKKAGFNMVRKHVKVEPGRYYYHCDRLGILVWQDMPNAGMWENEEPPGISPPWIRMGANPKDAVWPEEHHRQWVKEYKEMVDHLRDHPSVIIWSLFNESWGQHASMELGKMAKEYDPTRLICVASGGNFWPVGDIASSHSYPDPDFPVDDKRFSDYIRACGEMGGHGWVPAGQEWNKDQKPWSYRMPGTIEQWKMSYEQTMGKIRPLHEFGLSAAVYTQLADVETEVNGLMTRDRVPKVDAAWLKQVNDRVLRATGSRGRPMEKSGNP